MQEIFGLTRNESKVYKALIRSGNTTAGKLTKQLGMHRSAVYDALDMLVEKGLAAFIMQENKKYFKPHDPSRLLDYLETKKNKIEKEKKLLEKEVPKFRNLMNIHRQEQDAAIYKGRKGIKSVCEDVLKERKELLIFGSRGQFITLFPSYFINFQKRREKLGIPFKVMRTNRGVTWKKYRKFSEERFLSEKYKTPSATFVYGDKVAFILWSEDPMAFLVKSKKVAQSYRKYFQLLWRIAKP